MHTRWIETEFAGSIPPYSGPPGQAGDAGAGGGQPARERITVEVGGKRLEVVLPAGLGRPARRPARAPGRAGRRGRPGRGGAAAVGRWPAADGDDAGQPDAGHDRQDRGGRGPAGVGRRHVVVLEAMKMEQPLTAHKDGTVTGLAVEVGQTVAAGEAICQLKD